MTDTDTVKRPAAEADAAEPPKRAGRGRPVGDREAQRRKLLRAGIKVIAEEGYSGASLRKVAKEAGHTTGAITYYFADKEAMVGAIIEHMFDGFDAILDLGDGVTDLAKMYKRWVELNSNSDGWIAGFQLLARARHEPQFAEIYRERYKNYRARLTESIEKQQAAGTVRNDIPADLLADTIGSVGDGWMIMLPIETERFTPDRLDAIIASIMRLLQPVSPVRGG